MHNIQRAYKEITNKVKSKIYTEKETSIANISLRVLVEHYYRLDHFCPIEFDESGPLAVMEKGFQIPESVLTPEDMFHS